MQVKIISNLYILFFRSSIRSCNQELEQLRCCLLVLGGSNENVSGASEAKMPVFPSDRLEKTSNSQTIRIREQF